MEIRGVEKLKNSLETMRDRLTAAGREQQYGKHGFASVEHPTGVLKA